MKNNITLLLLLCLFTLLTASKCKKNTINPNSDNGLPPATQIGANIFACKVNGKPWISGTHMFDIGGGAGDTLSVKGSNPKDGIYAERFYIQVNKVNDSVSIYRLNDTTNNFARYSTNQSCFNIQDGYSLGMGYSIDGQLTITKLDRAKKILSGTFSFIIPTKYCDTLKITDGRFDIKYY